jgi:2',3'-cyclic-nucleotide 2'-phosphodiesterase (5'-nucleotidase family)
MQTASGLRILILGFIYDFKQSAKSVIVQNVEDIVSTIEFQQIILSKVDLILATGHYAPDSQEKKVIEKTIRTLRPDIPLILLTGHSHLAFFGPEDSETFVLQSDHFFDVIGKLDFEIIEDKIVNMTHEFITTNKNVFWKMSNCPSAECFQTPQGDELDKKLQQEFIDLKLNVVQGCSTRTFDNHGILSKTGHPAIYDLYFDQMLVKTLYPSVTGRKGIHYFTFANAFQLRVPLYQGEVWEDDIVSIMPFEDNYYVIEGVSGSDVATLRTHLTNNSPSLALYEDLQDYEDQAKDAFEFGDDAMDDDENSQYWLYPDDGIDQYQSYSVVATGYDIVGLMDVVNTLFPGKYKQALLKTSLGTRSLVRTYIQQNMRCNSVIA